MRWVLYFTAFVSGAAVLAIEIVGTRILGPFYGVSLFLWSSLITTTLVSLSVGYAVGGRLADRAASLALLGKILLAAGVWTALTAWMARPVIEAVEPVGLRGAVLLAALILFAPPLAALGSVSPISIRLAAKRVAGVGRAAGDLYAISTLGSVVAALVTGFFLVPNVGVRSLMILIGVLLGLGALATRLVNARERQLTVIGMVVVVGVGVGLAARLSNAMAQPGILAVEQSHFGELRVLDYGDGSRHLLIDGGVHSSVMIDSWEPLQPYIWVTDTAKQLFDEPGRLLLIGVGAGSTAMSFQRDGWQVTAVEIDPGVISLARRYFGLSLAEGSIRQEDGRAVLEHSDERYDLIVLDAFSSNSIPFHLFTEEAFGLAHARLAEGGVLLMNIESIGWHTPMVRAMGATLRQHFDELVALPVGADPEALTNLIVIASDRAIALRRPLDTDGAAGEIRDAAWTHRFIPKIEGARVLTDDRTPVDVWSEAVNAANRRVLHDGLARDNMHGVNW